MNLDNRTKLKWSEVKEEAYKCKNLREQQKLRFYKQPKLFKAKYKFYKGIEILYPLQYNQEIRSRDNSFLNDYEEERWKAHLKHPLINQRKIRDAKIVVFGLGGVGSNILLNLVYVGANNYKIVDHDRIELSNLNRQTLYTPNDIGKLKSEIAKKRVLEINPNLNIESYQLKVDYPLKVNLLKFKENNLTNEFLKIDKLIKWGDIIVNALDYYGSPYLINDLCIKNHKPYYWALCNHSFGEIFCYFPNKKTACLRCIFGPLDIERKIQMLRYRTQETKTVTKAVLGNTVISTGSLASHIILNDICELEHNNHGKYIILDTYKLKINKIPLKKHKKCECKFF